MKTLFNLNLSIPVICLLIFLSSCEAEKIPLKNGNLSIRQFSMREAKAKGNNRLIEAVNKIKNEDINFIDENARIIYDEASELYFDDEKGLYITDGDKESYTFPVIRTSTLEKVKNICFNQKPDGGFDVFLVVYDYTKEEAETMSEEELAIQEKQFIGLMVNGRVITSLKYICVDLFTVVSQQISVPINQGELTGAFGYQTITQTTVVTIASSCSWITDTTEIGGGDSGGSTGGGGGNVIGDWNGDIITGSLIADTEAQNTESMPLGWALEHFQNNLSPEGLHIYNSHPEFKEYLSQNNCSTKSQLCIQWAIDYLNSNNSSEQSLSFIRNLINPAISIEGLEDPQNFSENNFNYLVDNNFSDESINHLSNVIDEIIENVNNNTSFIDPNAVIFEEDLQNTILDINEYLDCFDTNQSAVITVFVDQPTANDNDAWSGNPTNPNTGHTFFAIKQGDIRRVLGFYPDPPVASLSNPSSTGAFKNDSNHSYDVSLSIAVNSRNLKNIINYIKSHSSTLFNLNSNNCTDVGLSVMRKAGLQLPSAYGAWGNGTPGSPYGGAGDNPGQFGQNIRNMPTPSGGVKTTNGGVAPSNTGGC